ncbi:DUF1707 SHOCT-like domain-containing protein [Nonomuraea africana]|uniref:DUF1707 domain-containing protein n=1 Tax=Nonomuraea africana TaxID=46171 RepID=A0ABR9KL18_9ACTN|nr:DUF1707 domain-containing protein [Nonomuraea africana]MBE1562709.1 hypothetical protein [Nonomuraea africana]
MTDPHMRVSDADRERAARQLQKAFAEGRLDAEELDERLGLAFGAKTYGDLTAPLSDLPAAGAFVPAVFSAPHAEAVVLESKTGDVTRSGDWPVPQRLKVVSKYGNATLDLSAAGVLHPVVHIDFDLKYGSAGVVLPDGATADVDGYQAGWGGAPEVSVPARPRPGLLHVRITGQIKYGGLEVRYPQAMR